MFEIEKHPYLGNINMASLLENSSLEKNKEKKFLIWWPKIQMKIHNLNLPKKDVCQSIGIVLMHLHQRNGKVN